MSRPLGGDIDQQFEQFYRNEFVATTRLARFLTSNPHVAEDLAQEAFVRVFRHASSTGRQIENPAALLRTTTVNVCRSWHRSEQRAELRMTRHGPVTNSLTEWERELDESLRRLPYDQRAVIVLRYWLGQSEAEIAHVLACRPGTVKSRHARALRSLRKELA